jgi:hypothetical protein
MLIAVAAARLFCLLHKLFGHVVTVHVATLCTWQACGTYTVTLTNNMVGYQAPAAVAPFNAYRDPLVTNLHTHGLHVSGGAGGDDMTVAILPGAGNTYIYKIPCDHAGETHIQSAAYSMCCFRLPLQCMCGCDCTIFQRLCIWTLYAWRARPPALQLHFPQEII